MGLVIHTQPESIANIALQPETDPLVQLTTPEASTAQNSSALYSPFAALAFAALVETGVLNASIPLESSDCIEPGTIAKVSIPDFVNHPSVIQTCLPPMSRALRRSPPIESQLLKMAPGTHRKWFLPHPSEHKETQCVKSAKLPEPRASMSPTWPSPSRISKVYGNLSGRLVVQTVRYSSRVLYYCHP